jgi:hypothetical protein
VPPTCDTTSEKFRNFNFDWSEVPQYIKANLDKGEFLSKRDFNDVVKIVMRQLNNISTVIPKNIVQDVAQKIGDKFPKSFYAFSNGKKTTKSPVKLIAKMIGRRNYMKAEDNKNSGIPKNVLKKRQKFDVSLVNSGGTLSQEQEKKMKAWKKELLQIHQQGEIENEKIVSKMISCFDLQRLQFDDSSKHCEILMDWPYIVSPQCFQNHIQKLKGVDIEMFVKNFNYKKEKIKMFMESCNRNKIAAIKSSYDGPCTDQLIVKYLLAFLGCDESILFLVSQVNIIFVNI